MSIVTKIKPTVHHVKKMLPILRMFILILICILSFSIRLFSVIQYESIIHEFDPWFNYRVAKYMVKHGLKAYFNWMDERSWYPMGRHIGHTTYPGLMITSTLVYRLFRLANIPIHIREVCVFTGPVVSAFTSIVFFLLAKEAWTPSAGLFVASIVAVVPGYISRSVAGSYDYESIAIFAIGLCFYLWIRAFRSGSVFVSVCCALSYFFMVSSWGGYIFVNNLIAIHACLVAALNFFAGDFDINLYIAYSIFFVIGSPLAAMILFVSIKSYLMNNLHISNLLVFLGLQTLFIKHMIESSVSKRNLGLARKIFYALLFAFIVVSYNLGAYFSTSFYGRIAQLIGLKPGVSLISSVAEHRSGSWKQFNSDLYLMVYFVPVSLLAIMFYINKTRFFFLIYLLFSTYFSFRMVRVILVLAPITSLFSGIGISMLLSGLLNFETKFFQRKRFNQFFLITKSASGICLAVCLVGFYKKYLTYCIIASRYYYSSPQVILKSNTGYVIDDMREGFLWLRYNTPKNATVMSWWDYGYQITGFAKRIVYVDNNTRVNHHIATIGSILGRSEKDAYKEMLDLKVDYLLVLFGGKIGYSSDDINKAYWIIKISSDEFPQKLSEVRNFRIDKYANPNFIKSMLFNMCYHRFESVNNGYDVTRQQKLEHKVNLKYIEEAYTTKNWLIRIYRVKRPEEIS